MARSMIRRRGNSTKLGKPGPARKRVLALASGGGHWTQLRRLTPAFDDSDVTFVTTAAGHRQEVGDSSFRVVPDANRWDKLGLVKCAVSVLVLMVRERPDVVISTGAAPGYFAIRFGKWVGACTIWIDSIANAEELSLSGQRAGRHADLWLTQWPHLAAPDGPTFAGNVLGDSAP